MSSHLLPPFSSPFHLTALLPLSVLFMSNLLSLPPLLRDSQPLPERVTDLQSCPNPKTVGQLRRFWGCQISTAVSSLTQSPPKPLFITSFPAPKSKVHTVTWTDSLLAAFKECKASLSQAALLAHPDPCTPLTLVTNASTTAMGAVLQEQLQDVWQALAFFSRKLSPAQQKYSAYDKELLAIYEAMKYFRHALEAWHFTILTDNKLLSFAFH